jgi:hypothetical protein
VVVSVELISTPAAVFTDPDNDIGAGFDTIRDQGPSGNERDRQSFSNREDHLPKWSMLLIIILCLKNCDAIALINFLEY